MSDQQTESASDCWPPQGIPVAISPANIEQHWEFFERQLRIMESWSQCISADDVRQCIAAGVMQVFGVMDTANKIAFAITRISKSGRGSICTAWLLASHFADDASISNLVDEAEAYARLHACGVLEINAYPAWADRLQGKLTAVIVERDLRMPHRLDA